jgi:predicted ester cyclase
LRVQIQKLRGENTKKVARVKFDSKPRGKANKIMNSKCVAFSPALLIILIMARFDDDESVGKVSNLKNFAGHNL